MLHGLNLSGTYLSLGVATEIPVNPLHWIAAESSSGSTIPPWAPVVFAIGGLIWFLTFLNGKSDSHDASSTNGSTYIAPKKPGKTAEEKRLGSTRPCSACSRPVYATTQICGHCGANLRLKTPRVIPDSESPDRTKPHSVTTPPRRPSKARDVRAKFRDQELIVKWTPPEREPDRVVAYVVRVTSEDGSLATSDSVRGTHATLPFDKATTGTTYLIYVHVSHDGQMMEPAKPVSVTYEPASTPAPNARSLHLHALEAYEGGDRRTALQLWEQGAHCDPPTSEAGLCAFYAARTHLEEGNLTQAAELSDLAVARGENTALALKGLSLARAGDIVQARRCWEAGLVVGDEYLRETCRRELSKGHQWYPDELPPRCERCGRPRTDADLFCTECGTSYLQA